MHLLLIFGIANPLERTAVAEHRDDRAWLRDAANILDLWIEAMHDEWLPLCWTTDIHMVEPVIIDDLHTNILGIPIAATGDWDEIVPLQLPTFTYIAPEDDPWLAHDPVGATRALKRACAGLEADIATAATRWEIARFTGRGIGLDFGAGRLYLISRHTENAAKAHQGAQ